jgi:archaellum biogenesis protein FlaJ (TadC family)
VLFQLPDGTPTGAIVLMVVVCLVLAMARVVKNLPKDAIKNFFEHRTKVNEIIAKDAKGRVATVQKQRLVFMGFMLVCAVVVTLALVASQGGEGAATAPGPGSGRSDAPASP